MLTGRITQKVAPLPSGLFSAQIFPPWASTTLLEINNPKPTPPASDFVTNFPNNLEYPGSMPVPVSFMQSYGIAEDGIQNLNSCCSGCWSRCICRLR